MRALSHKHAWMLGSTAAAVIPVLWQMPDRLGQGGGFVVYMDGSIQWLPYPGPFPFTAAFIGKVRSLMAALEECSSALRQAREMPGKMGLLVEAWATGLPDGR